VNSSTSGASLKPSRRWDHEPPGDGTTTTEITLNILQFLLSLGAIGIAYGGIRKLVDQQSVLIYGALTFTAIMGVLWLIGKLF
jgi:hypothetical protein